MRDAKIVAPHEPPPLRIRNGSARLDAASELGEDAPAIQRYD